MDSGSGGDARCWSGPSNQDTQWWGRSSPRWLCDRLVIHLQNSGTSLCGYEMFTIITSMCDNFFKKVLDLKDQVHHSLRLPLFASPTSSAIRSSRSAGLDAKSRRSWMGWHRRRRAYARHPCASAGSHKAHRLPPCSYGVCSAPCCQPLYACG